MEGTGSAKTGDELGSRNGKRAGISRRETRIAKNYDGNKDRDTLVWYLKEELRWSESVLDYCEVEEAGIDSTESDRRRMPAERLE